MMLILARCSGDSFRPLSAALILARCSGEMIRPFSAALILARTAAGSVRLRLARGVVELVAAAFSPADVFERRAVVAVTGLGLDFGMGRARQGNGDTPERVSAALSHSARESQGMEQLRSITVLGRNGWLLSPGGERLCW